MNEKELKKLQEKEEEEKDLYRNFGLDLVN